jgi:hypothetical protein
MLEGKRVEFSLTDNGPEEYQKNKPKSTCGSKKLQQVTTCESGSVMILKNGMTSRRNMNQSCRKSEIYSLRSNELKKREALLRFFIQPRIRNTIRQLLWAKFSERHGKYKSSEPGVT